MLSPELCPGGRLCTCWGEEGQPCTSPSAQGSCAPCSLPLHPLATAALPKTQHSQGGMKSKSSRGSTGICGGAKHLSFRGEQYHAVPAFLLQLEHRRGDASMHAIAQRWNLFPSHLLLLQLLPPKGAESMPLVRGAVSGLLAAAGQGRRPLVSFKYCSSCVLQSVSHADRTVSMSHTEIMPLAYRNMYSQPCSPPLSALLSSPLFSGMCQNVCEVQWFGVEV